MTILKKLPLALPILWACITPNAYADNQELAPMFGTWQCHAEASVNIPGGKNADSSTNSVKMVETYTATTTPDGMSVGDDTTIFYLQTQDRVLPIEVSSHSKGQYKLNDGTLKLRVLEWQLLQGRIYPKEKNKLLAQYIKSDAPASARSQFSAKMERLAEDFADTVAKSFQDRVGKEASMPFKLTSTGSGKMEKTFGTGPSASVHYCTRPPK